MPADLKNNDSEKVRLLLVMEQCNPAWSSVPQLAYQFYNQLRLIAEVTLVTHERNREGLSEKFPNDSIVFIEESKMVRDYYGVVARLTSRGGVNWPLQHTLSYPVYAEFDRTVGKLFESRIDSGEFDAVMGMTPILPRYPYRLSGFSSKVPFILGPVNGGLPFPEGFGGIARKEGARFNFLRGLTKLLPGYAKTYEQADRVIAGSQHTLGWIRETFSIDSPQLHYMAENGVADSYFENPLQLSSPSESIKLLFAGRLVPYKGGDMLLEAVALATKRCDRKIELSFVGDGPERENLEQLTLDLDLDDHVTFEGLVPPETMPDHFGKADLFCFPSIREFGGAVVLEAMASSVPCVVADHGGIGEYVTAGSGVKIAPKSREFLIEKFADAIVQFSESPEWHEQCAIESKKVAEAYRWKNKARQLLDVIEDAIHEKQSSEDVVLTA